LDFVLSPKKRRKTLISRHIIREFQNSKILAHEENFLYMMSQSHWVLFYRQKKKKEKRKSADKPPY
jgi:hypothetical protein